MSMEERIEAKLTEALTPSHLRLENESHRHNVPAGSESHWNVIVVSEAFAGRSRLQRHRMVHGALGDELAAGIHALTFKAMTPAEWTAAGGDLENPAPPCRGGGRR